MTNEAYDPTDLTGQEAAAAEGKRLQRHERTKEVEDFNWIMGDARGRRFVWRLLEKAGVYRSSFTGNSTTFFNEGMRNIGLMIVAEIHELTPEAYALMLKENKRDGSKPTSS